MDAVRAALFQHLVVNAGVVAHLGAPGAVYHETAPREAVPPYVLFHRQAGTDQHAFGGETSESQLWLVKAVDRGPTASRAEDLAAALYAALQDAPLVIDGKPPQAVFRETFLDYTEGDGGETFHHHTATYRVAVQPAS